MANNIMKSFNTDRKYTQQLQVLQTKYSFLIKDLSTEKQDELITLLKDKYQLSFDEKDESGNRAKLRSRGIMQVFSEIPAGKHKELIDEIYTLYSTDVSQKGESESKFKKVLLSDIHLYSSILAEKKSNEGENFREEKAREYHNYIQKKIIPQLKDALIEKGQLLTPEKSEYVEEDSLYENEQDNLSLLLRDNVVDQVVYFHAIQSIFRKYNYILTLRDIGTLKSMLADLDQGRMIFLAGDTGSGKTELARLAAKLYLELKGITDPKRAPILVSGSRETTKTDLTIEKTISSENMMTTSQEDTVWGERTEQDAEDKLIETIQKKQNLRARTKDMINEKFPEKEAKELGEEVDTIDLDKYNLFTKYHAKGIVKAMHDGVPLILDEMNAIDPGVLTELNDYLTRKVGDKITLPNGLGSFKVKDGFCIIATGNDPTANTKKDMYTSRYKLDQALIDRMRTIDKNYLNQIDSNHTTKTLADVDTIQQIDDIPDYMSENEIYGVLLMFLFDNKGKKSDISALTTATKAGFEVMKESFVGENSTDNKKAFFSELKHFAVFIKKIQDAFQKKEVLCDGQDIGNLIDSRVFSMRKLREIIKDYQSDTKSLFYHIYNKFLSQGNGNEDEMKGLIYALKESGLMPGMENEILSLEGEMFNKIKRYLKGKFEEEKNPKNTKISILNRHTPKTLLSDELITSKLLLTKQDLYEEYFKSTLDEKIDDQEIISQFRKDKKMLQKDNGEKGENAEQNDDLEQESTLLEEVKGMGETIQEEIYNRYDSSAQNKYFSSLSSTEIAALEYMIQELFDKKRPYSAQELEMIRQTFNEILDQVADG